jgi:hypothetical protein
LPEIRVFFAGFEAMPWLADKQPGLSDKPGMLNAVFSENPGKIGGGIHAAVNKRFGGCYGGFEKSKNNNKVGYTGQVTL